VTTYRTFTPEQRTEIWQLMSSMSHVLVLCYGHYRIGEAKAHERIVKIRVWHEWPARPLVLDHVAEALVRTSQATNYTFELAKAQELVVGAQEKLAAHRDAGEFPELLRMLARLESMLMLIE
jgi:hypothetical protein